MSYVSRAGEKLDYALRVLEINISGLTCADFGSSTGGFADCLFQRGAAKVYTVETGYGVLDYKLRQDKRVIVMEKQNAMHVELPEKADLITIDTGWTKLEKVIPNAFKNLKTDGHVLALVKPHYESEPRMLRKGKLQEDFMPEVLNGVRSKLLEAGTEVLKETESPLLGGKGKNKEYFFYIKKLDP